MSEQETKCYHEGFNRMVDGEGFPTYDYKTPCPDCGKTQGDIYMDPNDIDPTTRVSQQPHGKQTYHCNKCDGFTEPITWDGQECCSMHQRTYEDGTQLYDSEDPYDDW